MKKSIKFVTIFFLLLILLIVLNLLLTNSNDDDIRNYLIDTGYIVESDDDSRLVKMIDNETLEYFSLADYTLTRIINDQSNAFQYSLTMNYDYRNHELIYNYHINYSDNINVLLKGTYHDGVYTCDKEFSTASLTSNDISNICDLVEIKVEYFYQSAQILFKNYRFIEYMENVKVE